MSRYAFIDRIFGDTEDEETVNEEFDAAGDAEDNGSEASEIEEEDDTLPEEDDDMLARLDKEFRKLRARVRASTDPSELWSMRAEHTAALAERQTPTVRHRTLDIIEAIDDRVTDLRARRGRSE